MGTDCNYVLEPTSLASCRIIRSTVQYSLNLIRRTAQCVWNLVCEHGSNWIWRLGFLWMNESGNSSYSSLPHGHLRLLRCCCCGFRNMLGQKIQDTRYESSLYWRIGLGFGVRSVLCARCSVLGALVPWCFSGAWANNKQGTLVRRCIASFPFPLSRSQCPFPWPMFEPWLSSYLLPATVGHSSLIKFTEAKQLCLPAHLFS